jgi:hypothetical protein
VLNVLEAVVVNHNTSPFAELALRSLWWSVRQCGAEIRITVVDNHSVDGTGPLRAAVRECDAVWELSRWPAGKQSLTTHGDVLRDFVLARPRAAGYLLVESDICFLQPASTAVMLAELDDDPVAWAVQARLLNGAPVTADSFREAVRRQRRPLDLTARLTLETDDGDVAEVNLFHQGRRMPRCHPGCALIRNSEAFQLAARHIGFSASWAWSNDPQLGGLSDTLSLVSRVMRTHNRRHRISQASVIHFWHGTRLGFGAHQRRLLDHLRRGEVSEFVAACAAGLAPTAGRERE